MPAESVESLCQRARESMEQRNWEKSRQLYLQALSLRADAPDVHYGLATVCFQMRDLPSAAYHFKEVTRLDPLRAGAYINLGAVQNLLQQYDEAVTVLRRGLQLDSARFGLARERLVAAVRAEGVALDEGFRALHVGRSPSRLRRAGPLAEAERAGAGAVVLNHPVLLGSDDDLEQVAVAVEKAQAHAARLT